MLVYKWVGVFKNRHGYVTKTIEMEVREFAEINEAISKHVSEWKKEGWELQYNNLNIVFEEV
jgi:hypothetical protein